MKIDNLNSLVTVSDSDKKSSQFQDLMREDLRNFFQSPFCFLDPKMATVLFPSLR
ncbi:unnamed protein product [Camellia sinensis]